MGALVFSLLARDFELDGLWQFARELEADAYGLIQVQGITGAPRFPILWAFKAPDEIALALAGADPKANLPIDLQLLIDQFMPRFFTEAVEPALLRRTETD